MLLGAAGSASGRAGRGRVASGTSLGVYVKARCLRPRARSLRGKRERSDPWDAAALRLSVCTGGFTLVLPSRRAGARGDRREAAPSVSPPRFGRTRFLATAGGPSCPDGSDPGRLSCSLVAAAGARRRAASRRRTASPRGPVRRRRCGDGCAVRGRSRRGCARSPQSSWFSRAPGPPRRGRAPERVPPLGLLVC